MRLLILALGLVAYRKLLWSSSSHGVAHEVESWFFVPADTSAPIVILISAWLLYRRRERLRNLTSPGGPGWLVVALGLAAGAFFLWGTYTRAYDLLVPSLMLNALACGLLYGGPPAVRVLSLPVAMLIFAIPMPAPLLSRIVWSAQLWTAEYAGWIFFMLQIPVHVSGDLIYRVGQTFEVIETCSGLRSVETLTLLSVLMADLFKRGHLHGLLLIAAAPVVAFAMNGFRVVTLILNPESEALAVHNFQGVMVLLCGLVLLYLYDGRLASVLKRWRPAQPGPRSEPARRSAAPRAEPGPWRGLAIAAMLMGSTAASFWLPAWPVSWGAPLLPPHDRIPLEMGSWGGTDLKPDYSFFSGSVGFFYRLHRHYKLSGRHTKNPEPVELFIGLGLHKHRDVSPFSPKNAYPSSGWVVEDEGVKTLEPGSVDVSWRVLHKSSRRVLVYYWHDGDRGFAREVLRSLLALDTSPFRRQRRVLVYRMSTELRGLDEDDLPRAHKHIRRLFREVYPHMQYPLGEGGLK